VGNGVIIDPYIFDKEISKLRDSGVTPENNLFVSKKAHLILPTHRLLDAVYEKSKGKQKIGSTLKGIGPCYTDKISRTGIRVGDLKTEGFDDKYQKKKQQHFTICQSYGYDLNEIMIDNLPFREYEQKWLETTQTLLKMNLVDSEHMINEALKNGDSVLAEGAQGTMLDVDFGSYPFVTSSNTIVSSVCSGLGVAPQKIGKVFGVFKAYCTRVGSGPFPTELFDEDGENLRKFGHEFGSTTGRPRRCGWLDLPALKYAIMLNGVTDLVITKADVMDRFEYIKIGEKYSIDGNQLDYFPFEINDKELIPEYSVHAGWKTDITKILKEQDLPLQLLDYIAYVEQQTQVPVSIVSVGPDRKQTIIR
jgi:adenylosuccinate synthase